MQRGLLLVSVIAIGFSATAYSQLPANSHGQERSAAKPLVVEVDQTSLHLSRDDRGVLRSSPFRIYAGSILPRWRISVQPGQVRGPGGFGSVMPPRAYLVPERSLDDPGKHHVGPPIALDDMAVMAVGGPTGGRIHEVNSYTLVVEPDSLAVPGRYESSLALLPEVPGRAAPREAITIEYDWEIPEMLAVRVLRGRLMDFGTLSPGIYESRSFTQFNVYSNHHQSEIVIQISELVGDNGEELPGSATCLGHGTSLAEARQDALEASFGRNEVRIMVGPGEHTFFLTGRLQLAFDDPPGTYTGEITMTNQVTQW